MSEPTTGFEDRVAAEEQPNWTSLAEEVAFLDAVVALGDRVSYKSVGKSVENRDIWLVTVGIGSGLDARPNVLTVAQQHGREVAGREASLELIRHFQTTEDAGEVAYLSEAALHFMPTCNPDGLGNGWNTGSRNNANNVDMNRGHVALAEPEPVVIHEVIRDLNPAIVIDAHEAINGDLDVGMEFNWTLHTEATAALRSTGEHIVNNILRPAIDNLGFAEGIYPLTIPNRANLMNSSGLRHCIGILFETARTATPNSPVRVDRVLMQRVAMQEVIDYHAANVATLETGRLNSVSGKVSAGRSKAAVDFQNSTVVNPGPLAYRVTSAQIASVQKHFDTWALGYFRDGDDVIVPLGQESKPIIPFAFDSASNIADGGNVISATRLDSFDAFTNIKSGGDPLMPRRWTGRGWVEGRARRSADEGWQ